MTPDINTGEARFARAAGEQLLHAAAEVGRVVAAATAAEGLTPTEGRALRYLHDAVPQRRLAALLDCDAARVSNIVQRLTSKGLVRQDVGDDRRMRVVTLTPEGVRAVERIGARLFETSPLVHRLDEHEREQLHALLTKLAPNSED